MATYKGKYTSAQFLPREIHLKSVSYTTDTIGQSVPFETDVKRLGYISSVSATEDERAGQKGFKAVYEAVVWSNEYAGEELAEVDGKRFQIYRTYRRSDGRTELYLGQRAGSNYGNNQS